MKILDLERQITRTEISKGRNIFFLNPDTILLNNAILILSDFLIIIPVQEWQEAIFMTEFESCIFIQTIQTVIILGIK
jgi:hypothetical protein